MSDENKRAEAEAKADVHYSPDLKDRARRAILRWDQYVAEAAPDMAPRGEFPLGGPESPSLRERAAREEKAAAERKVEAADKPSSKAEQVKKSRNADNHRGFSLDH